MQNTRVLFIGLFLVLSGGTICLTNAASNERGSDSSSSLAQVPAWAKNAIWYQIFPERFRNGDPKNDPKPSDLAGSWPHEVATGWKVSNWIGDWYELQPWEKNDGKGFYFHAQQRRYGGDLQGVLDKLDYLKDLGITAIYLNPLFESPSLHKYDATMYHHIDNNFGPDAEGDKAIWASEHPADPSSWKWTAADKLFLTLLDEAHKRGIRVIIDGVFNHVGYMFWAFEDVKKNQQQSKFVDWFTIKRWDDPATQVNEFDYQCWYGARELPEIREDGNGLVAGPREHVHAVIKRWMDPNGDGNPQDGIDGWRLDVAEMVNPNFWKEFRTWVRALNPEAYIAGEVWWEDWNNGKMFNAAPWLQGDMFDAVMNYRWAREAVRFFAGDKTKISASEFNRRLTGLLKDYPMDINYVLLNLYDSHDTDRLGSRMVNVDLSYDKNVGANDNHDYNVRKPNAEELRTQRLMALFQMTYVGAPTIYYGTEAGMWGADDPDERKPMLWKEFQYAPEEALPRGGQRPGDENVFNQELFDWYAKLTKIRQRYDALRVGTFDAVLTDDAKDIFVFRRATPTQVIYVALNNSPMQQEADIQFSSVSQMGTVQDVLTGSKYAITNGNVKVPLKSKSGAILLLQDGAR